MMPWYALATGQRRTATPSGVTMLWDGTTSHGAFTLSNSDRTVTSANADGGNWETAKANFPLADASYFEVVLSAGSNTVFVGLAPSTQNCVATDTHCGKVSNGIGYLGVNGALYNNAATSTSGPSWNTGDVIGVAYKGGKVWFAVNNSWINSGNPAGNTNEAWSGLTGDQYAAISSLNNNTGGFTLRAKAADQTYSPPSGFNPAGV